MKNLNLKLCLVVLISLQTFTTVEAQNIEAVTEKPINKTTVENQLNVIVSNSAEQNGVKMVRKADLEMLSSDVITLLSRNENDLKASKEIIESKKAEIRELLTKVDEANLKVTATDTANETFLFLGLTLSKALYHSVMWSMVFTLLIFAVFLTTRFKKANNVTRGANEKLAEVEEEFESFKRNAIEREQKLRRQLQDEINKQKRELADVS